MFLFKIHVKFIFASISRNSQLEVLDLFKVAFVHSLGPRVLPKHFKTQYSYPRQSAAMCHLCLYQVSSLTNQLCMDHISKTVACWSFTSNFFLGALLISHEILAALQSLNISKQWPPVINVDCKQETHLKLRQAAARRPPSTKQYKTYSKTNGL